jgi:putative peptidoglycan lipid II flippase
MALGSPFVDGAVSGLIERAPFSGSLSVPGMALSGVASDIGGQRRARRLGAINLGILGAIVSLAGAAVAARALGMINQVVFADRFGASAAMDAYFVTLALPTLLTNLVIGALEAGVIPTYIRLTSEHRTHDASIALSSLINLLLLILGPVTIAMVAFPQIAVRLVAPGVSQQTVDMAAALAPLVVPTLLLNVFAGFVTSVLNATRRFALPAVASMVVPAGILVATLALGSILGVEALAFGLLAGTLLQFLILLALAAKTRSIRYRPVLRLSHPEVRIELNQFWPMVVGSAVGLVNPVVDQMVASALGSGDIASLNYALKIVDIPVTMIFVASARAVFPYFSGQAARRDIASLKETLRVFAWLVGLVTLGITVTLLVFARPIIQLLFMHGAFTSRDVQRTSLVLMGFAVGLVPMAIGFMVPRVFSALHRNDVLFKIALYTIVVNVSLDILLASFLGLPGIALATSVDYLLTVTLQITILSRLIGPLQLWKPPVHAFRQAINLGSVRVREAVLEPVPTLPGQAIRQVVVVVVGLATLAWVAAHDVVQSLRAACGALLAIVFLRSPYLLLLVWAAVAAFYDVYVGDHSVGFVLALGSLPTFALIALRDAQSIARRTPAVWTYAAFAFWLLFGALRSPLGIYQFGIDELGIMDFLAVMLLAISQLTTLPRLDRFLTILLATSTTLSAVGVLEFVLRLGGHWGHGAFLIYQVGGIFGWSNSFGFYLDLILPLCLYRLLTAPREWRPLWSGVFALHCVALALTFGRAAIIAALVMVVVTAALLAGRAGTWLIRGIGAVVVATAALALVPGLGLLRRLTDGVLTLNARTSAWGYLLPRINFLNPFGAGYYSSYTLLLQAHPGDVIAPHSLYLQVLFDSGVVGLLLLAATFALLIHGAWRRARTSQGPARVAASVAAGGLAGAVLYLGFGNEIWDFALGTHFWFLAALPFLPALDRWQAHQYAGEHTAWEGQSAPLLAEAPGLPPSDDQPVGTPIVPDESLPSRRVAVARPWLRERRGG